MTTEKEATTVDVNDHHHAQPHPPQYEGSSFPQPAAPPPLSANYPPPNYYPPQGYVVAEPTHAPLRAEPLPCGCGIGWVLFIIGFFLVGIPWYCGAIILICVRTIDNRERPGYIACTIAAVLSTLAAIIEAIIRAAVQ